MATFTERLELLIDATSTNAVRELNKTGAAAEELTTKQKIMGGVTQTASGFLGQFGITAEQTGTALKVAGVAAGAFAATKVVEFAHGAADEFSNLTGEVRGFQRVAGTTAEDSSKLVFAVKELGIAPDTAAGAFGRFATRLGNNHDLLKDYNVEVAKNKDGTTDLAGTVANLSEAYQNTEDPTKRAALANAAFGRSWQVLAPLLSKGKDDLADIFKFADTTHQVFSQDDLERGRQYTVATRQLDAALQGLKVEIGSAVVPAFTSAAQTGTGFITGLDKMASSAGGFKNVIGTVFDISPYENAAALVSSASDLMQGHFADAGKEFLQSIPVIGNAATVLDRFTGVLGFGGEETKKYTDQQKNLQDATQKVFDLSVQGKEGTKEYADAVAAAKDASKNYADTNRQVAESLQSSADAAFNATQQHLALASANLGVQGSMLNLRQALADQTKAQHDANDAAQVGVDQSAQVEAADIKSQQAILGVIDAAQKRAVQALGPSASAEAQHKAAVDATTTALENMAATVPGTIGELQKLGYQVLTLPNGEIVVDANTTPAEQKIAALHAQIADFLAFANQPGAYNPLAFVGGSGRAAPASAPNGASSLLMPVAAGLEGPSSRAALSAAPLGVAGASSFTPNVNITVVTGGLGADAPEIQRAVVAALRGYVARNGPVRDVVGL